MAFKRAIVASLFSSSSLHRGLKQCPISNSSKRLWVVCDTRAFSSADGQQQKPSSLREQILTNASSKSEPIVAPVINHSSSSSSSSNTDERDSLEREKELYAVKRAMSRHYSSGDYANALESGMTLHDMVVSLYGKKNAVYASCLNNIALMVSVASVSLPSLSFHCFNIGFTAKAFGEQ